MGGGGGGGFACTVSWTGVRFSTDLRDHHEAGSKSASMLFEVPLALAGVEEAAAAAAAAGEAC